MLRHTTLANLTKSHNKSKSKQATDKIPEPCQLVFLNYFLIPKLFPSAQHYTILSKSKNPNPHKSVLQFDFSSLLSLYNAAAFYTWNHAVWILNSRGWWLCNYHNYIVEHTSSLFMHSPQAYLMFPFMLNQNLTLSLKVPVLGVM